MRRWLDTKEAADVIGFSYVTMKDWRQNGGGPPFSVVGRSVRYALTDLEAWMKARRIERRRGRGRSAARG